MTGKQKMWMLLFGITVFLTVAARYAAYFPGDVTTARFIQGVAPASYGWARLVSATAKFPWSLALLTITVASSWRVAGSRAVAAALFSFIGMWIMGQWLSPLLARPRPSAELVSVPEQLSGYSFPSIFALTYASTIGFLAMLFAKKSAGIWRVAAPALCCLLLLAGGAARIALGAHWPSDVMLSYLIGLFWAAFLLRFV